MSVAIVTGSAGLIGSETVGFLAARGFTVVGLDNDMRQVFFCPEASTACAATILLITFLGIIPAGLIWAQVEGVQLRSITKESERAGEGLMEDEARAREV